MSTTTVTLARCATYRDADIDAALARALAPLGGWPAFVRPGARVLLKPNLIAAAPADEHATTHPAFVAGVVRAVLAAGGQPLIGDDPAFGSIRGVARACGLLDVAQRYQVPLVELDDPRRLALASRLTPRGLTVDRTADEVDVLINLPKLKAHSQVLLTAAVKNLYGCVPGKRKVWRHVRARHHLAHFADMLIANARALQPELSVVDGIIAMEGRGPRRGAPRPLGVVVAGADCVAVDRVVCEIIGCDPSRYEILQAARRAGFGETDLARIRLAGDALAEAHDPAFRLPPLLDDISFDPWRALTSWLRQLWITQVAERRHPAGAFPCGR